MCEKWIEVSSGEIRDAGPYPQKPTMKVRITEGRGWYSNKVGEIFEVYKEPSEYWLENHGSVAYEVAVDPGSIIRHKNCTVISETPWYKLPADVFDPLVEMPHKFYDQVLIRNERLYDALTRGEDFTDSYNDKIYMLRLYRAGIVRDKGKMPMKQDYTKAFSVDKDALWMRVDWNKIEVTKENALEISIASWEWFYDQMQKLGRKMARPGALSCALCRLYHPDCGKCVIAKSTGKRGCQENVPYQEFLNATTLHEALDACREEITFLKGLQ